MNGIFSFRMRKSFAMITILALVFSIIQVPVNAQESPPASPSVSNVTITDPDAAGYGLDGRDFMVSWIPGSTAPSGYMGTALYIVDAATDLNVSNVSSYTAVGFFSQFLSNTWNGGEGNNYDSSNQVWDPGTSYKACVLTYAISSDLVCSTSNLTPISDTSVEDAGSPFIEHWTLRMVVQNTNPVVHAWIEDDQTTASQFANSENGASAKMVYKIDGGATQEVSGTVVSGTDNLFKFTATGAVVTTSFAYYLVATDTNNNTSIFSQGWNVVTESEAAQYMINPWISASAGSNTVSGRVTDYSGTAVASAYVYIPDLSLNGTATNGTGDYTLNNVPSDYWQFAAEKSDYCGSEFGEMINGNKTGLNFSIGSGSCSADFSGGGGGGGDSTGGMSGSDKPYIWDSRPCSGCNQQYQDRKVLVKFSQAMDASTINDALPTGADDNVVLYDKGGAAVAGVVTYCENSSTSGCLVIQDDSYFTENVLLFTASEDFTKGAYYRLVIGSAVKSSTGKSIESWVQGGGYELEFGTDEDSYSTDMWSDNFGTGGQYQPPFVQFMQPWGMTAPNAKIMIGFNTAMDTGTLETTDNIVVRRWNADNSTTNLTGTLTMTSDNKTVILTPASPLTVDLDHEVVIKGGVADSTGKTFMDPSNPDYTTAVAFSGFFTPTGSNDTTAPTIYPVMPSGFVNVGVNEIWEAGFDKVMDPTTFNGDSVTVKRGTTNVSVTLSYNASNNNLKIIPNTVYATNTQYTVMFVAGAGGVKDLYGNTLTTDQSFTFTTDSTTDTTGPRLTDGKCDDWQCWFFFSEPMKKGSGSTSITNTANWQITTGPDGTGSTVDLSNGTFTYDDEMFAVQVEGLTIPGGQDFVATVSNATDIAGNAISSPNSWHGRVEGADSFNECFDAMFCGGGGEENFKPGSFGGEWGESSFFDNSAAWAFPFNSIAGLDSGVFQVGFRANLQNGDIVKVDLDSGFSCSNIIKDGLSPFARNVVDFGPAGYVVSFETANIVCDSETNSWQTTVTVTGSSTNETEQNIFDFRNVINSNVPKSWDTAGYTADIKVIRAGTVIVSQTSMPFFISKGGSNTINLNVYAGSSSAPDAVSGPVNVFGGGPGGMMDAQVSINNGVATKQYASMPNGCFFFGTDPFVTIGSNSYFGQQNWEPLCVEDGETATTNIVLSSASGSGVSSITFNISGGSAITDTFDMGCFAGGRSGFAERTFDDVNLATTTTFSLPLRGTGNYFAGCGPAFQGGTKGGMSELPFVLPPPLDVNVQSDGSCSPGFHVPPGVTLTQATCTITYAVAIADKAITGTVTDGTTAQQNVEVFMHSGGQSGEAFSRTDESGRFTIKVSDFGIYELGAFKPGTIPRFESIEVKPDGSDAGSDIDIYYKGQLVTSQNPLVLKIRIPQYSISGKVSDSTSSSSKVIANTFVFAVDESDGTFIPCGPTDNNGNYNCRVDAGTFTINAELPPDKSDLCGKFSKSVTVTNENKSNQNLAPSVATCYTISGTVTVDGSAISNAPVACEEWNTTLNRPSAGAMFKPTSTDANGAYQAKVAGADSNGNARTYRCGIFDPNYGEIGGAVAVSNANVTLNLTQTSGILTFIFTGGTASHNAFINLSSSTDRTVGKGHYAQGLNNSVALTVSAGSYKYNVDVFGVGQFSGSAATGTTVTINLSSSTLTTLMGTVEDNNGTEISGALVVATDSTGENIETITGTDGAYSLTLQDDTTYTVDIFRDGYIADGSSVSQAVSDVTTLDFTESGVGPSLVELDKSIVGEIVHPQGATLKAFAVYAKDTETERVVKCSTETTDGSYECPVKEGEFEIYSVAPGFENTQLSSDVTVGASDSQVTASDLTLTTDTTPIDSKSDSKVIAANTGGTFDDTENTGVKVVAPAGSLQTGQGNVTVSVERQTVATDSTLTQALANTKFSVTATGGDTGTSQIKDLNDKIDLSFDYTDIIGDLPEGVTEADLKVKYWSNERGEYVEPEFGFTIDPDTNTATAKLNHLTDFIIGYTAPSVSSGNNNNNNGGSGNNGSSGSGGGTSGGGTSGGKATPAQNIVFEDETEVSDEEKATVTKETKTESSQDAEAVETAEATPFMDVSNIDDSGKAHWAEKYILALYEQGVIQGRTESTFAPDESLNRAELVKMILKTFRIDVDSEVTEMPFSDVDTSAWYAPYVAKAYELGIVEGYEDGTFRPEQSIQRSEALKIVFETAGISIPDSYTSGSDPFNDVPSDQWFTKYIHFAYDTGVVIGYDDGNFHPDWNITRAEFSKVAVKVRGDY